MQATRNPFKSEARPEDRHRRPRTPLIIPDRVAERAATAYDEEPESGCWISTYSTGSHGYAQIGWQERPKVPHRRATTAHRAAWVYWTGAQIPVGMTIDHKCKNRRCVNPDHLRMLTNFENARRTGGRDWQLGECINGHPNSELREIAGRIRCGLCVAKWQRDYRARKAVA